MQRQRRRRGISPVKAVAVAIIVVLLIVVAAGMITLGFVTIIPTTTVQTSPPYNSPVSGLTMAGLPAVFNVTPGDAYTFDVTVEATNGSSIPVTLAPAHLPAWLSVSLSQASGTTPFNTTVLLNASNTFVGPFSTFGITPGALDYTLPAAHVLFETNISRLGAAMAITDVVPIIPFMNPDGFGINGFFYPISQSTNGGIVNITEIQTNATWSSSLWKVGINRYSDGTFTSGIYFYNWQYPLEPLNPYYNETYINYYAPADTGAYGISAGNYNLTVNFTFANHAVFIYKAINQYFYSNMF